MKNFQSHKRLKKPLRGMKSAIIKKSNSPQIDKTDKLRPGTRARTALEKAKKDEWLRSEHGQQTIRDMRAAEAISSNLIAKKYPSISDDDVRFYMAKADKLDEEMNLIINKALSQMI